MNAAPNIHTDLQCNRRLFVGRRRSMCSSTAERFAVVSTQLACGRMLVLQPSRFQSKRRDSSSSGAVLGDDLAAPEINHFYDSVRGAGAIYPGGARAPPHF